MTDYTWHIPDPQTQPEFYADIPVKRLIAFGIDTVVILVLCVLILPFTAFTGIFFFPLLMLMVGFAYRTATLSRWSATPGMRLVAIEFRTSSGAHFDPAMAMLHTGLFSASFVILPVQIASVMFMATTPKAQGLSDLFLGTVAVNRKARS